MRLPPEREVLEIGARELGIDLSAASIDALIRIVDELEAANAQFNLTAIRDRPGMLSKHLLDSLSLQPYLRGSSVADVGTGAGFPGLPLAVVNPARRFALIEATGKKARYVAQTAQKIAIDNVDVIQDRAEHYRPEALFDTVIARALASLPDFIAYAGHLCAAGGRLLAMKGKRPDAEISHLPKAFRVLAVHRLRVPGVDGERHLVEISRAGPKSSKS